MILPLIVLLVAIALRHGWQGLLVFVGGGCLFLCLPLGAWILYSSG